MYRCAKGHERRENCELELESFVSIYAGALLARRLSISDVVYAAEKRGEREDRGKKRGLRNYRRDSKRRPRIYGNCFRRSADRSVFKFILLPGGEREKNGFSKLRWYIKGFLFTRGAA